MLSSGLNDNWAFLSFDMKPKSYPTLYTGSGITVDDTGIITRKKIIFIIINYSCKKIIILLKPRNNELQNSAQNPFYTC